MASEHNGVLAGRRAVVTGAGRGLGRSIALALAGAGADVALTARTAADLELAAAEIAAQGRRSLAVPADVTDPAQVARLAEQVGAA
jgi:NAD(P)-dependent dehydrogenase (short-subunit alcohol dehydrogenase family)